jgi:D-glycero-D-manno-heptose 1,7-bisphosphate phosphatase
MNKKNNYYECAILCGGYGKRLKKLTSYTPKPLLEVAGKPFLLHLIQNLQRFGIKKIILLTHYKNEQFKKFIEYHKLKQLKLIKEKKKLGTGGAIINALKYLRNNFYIINGDTLFDINYSDLKLKNYPCIVAGIKKKNKNYYYLYKKKDNVITAVKKNKTSGLISGGVIFAKKKFFKKIKIESELDLDKDILWPSVSDRKVFIKEYKNIFHDIGDCYNSFCKTENIINKIKYKPCAYLDRDGVINYDRGYVVKKKDFKWRQGAKEAIKYLNDNNYYVIIVSNQAGIAHGYYNANDVENLHDYISQELDNIGAHIDKYYYSPYHPNAKLKKFRKKSDCRKPNSGMLKKSFKDFSINKKKSFFIGDNVSDSKCANKENIKFFFAKNSLFKQVKRIIKLI